MNLASILQDHLLLIFFAMFLPMLFIIFAWQPIAKWRNPNYKPETGMSGITSGQTFALIVWAILISVLTPILGTR